MKVNEQNISNNNSNKAPPYPVEPSTLPNEQNIPESSTADIVTAVQYGFYDRVVQLIDADPQLTTMLLNENVTVLHWAAINNRIDIAKYLISKGAKVDAVGGNLKSTPLQWAVRDGKLEMVILLLSYNAQISVIDAEGLSCIHVASIFGHTGIVAYLAAKGQNIDLPDENGVTPLMHAALHARNREPTQLIARLGGSVNYQNPNNKYTPLHYAIAGNNIEAIRVLIECGAKTNITNDNNEDAFDFARKSNYSRHLVFLLARLTSSIDILPKWLQLNRSTRRFGIKLLPYIILIFIGVILELNIWFVYRITFILLLISMVYASSLLTFDETVHENLPIAIAQASIFSLYGCYLYFFLPYVHAISFTFVALVVLTYFSWSNYYYSEKCDPGYLSSNRDQVNRLLIQLVEQNLFTPDAFCTWCLIRRPLRSKHCRQCRKCVSKFDHHCPWIDNCVGERNLKYFVGFLFFTPICLCFYLHGAYLYFYYNCNITTINEVIQIVYCSPSVLWYTGVAIMHITWISGLGFTILAQIAKGYTTNERINFWRYPYLRGNRRHIFSFGIIQNYVDLINRRILWYSPINIDWSRIYTLEDFYDRVPTKFRQRVESSTNAQ